MTKRVQLILKVRNHLENEFHYAQHIEALGQRLPKVLVPKPKISSQRKLSF